VIALSAIRDVRKNADLNAKQNRAQYDIPESSLERVYQTERKDKVVDPLAALQKLYWSVRKS